MRHRVAGKKLGRNGSHRKALVRNMMRSFFLEFGKKQFIITTRVKAKFIQPHIEKMITLSREKSVHNIRRAMSVLQDRSVVQKLFDEIGPYYLERPGGYTRVLRLATPRLGDNSTRAYLGYVREDEDLADGDCRSRDQVGTDPGAPKEEVSGEEASPAEGSPAVETEAAEEAQASQEADSSDEAETPDEADAAEEPEASKSESSSDGGGEVQGKGSESAPDEGDEDQGTDDGAAEDSEKESPSEKDDS